MDTEVVHELTAAWLPEVKVRSNTCSRVIIDSRT